MELPLWPPILALVLGAVGYAYAYLMSKRFDRKHGQFDPGGERRKG